MSSLYRIIRRFSNAEKYSDSFHEIYVHSVRYLCGCITAFDYQRILKTMPITVSAKRFRLEIQRHSNLTLNLKLLMLKMVTVRGLSRETFDAHATDVEAKDRTVCFAILKGLSWVKAELRARLDGIKSDNPTANRDGVMRIFHDAYSSVMRYVKGLVYAKMRFIVKSENLEFQDLHNEVMSKVYTSLVSLVPTTECFEYIVNYMKRSAHNHVINMIKAATTQKRGRLVNVGKDKHDQHQFSMLCSSFSQLNIVDDEGNSVELEGEDHSFSSFELKYSINEVVNQLGKRPRKQRFITILMGHDDAEFTKWLKQKSIARESEDHVDVQNRTDPSVFNKYVADFLRLTSSNLDRFLASLKSKLQPA